jgi:hypothetical protein
MYAYTLMYIMLILHFVRWFFVVSHDVSCGARFLKLLEAALWRGPSSK